VCRLDFKNYTDFNVYDRFECISRLIKVTNRGDVCASVQALPHAVRLYFLKRYKMNGIMHAAEVTFRE
jgi:hypothetical protein